MYYVYISQRVQPTIWKDLTATIRPANHIDPISISDQEILATAERWVKHHQSRIKSTVPWGYSERVPELVRVVNLSNGHQETVAGWYRGRRMI
jgi:hypothetical protein